MNNIQVPVLMYHSVTDNHVWLLKHLTLPVKDFEYQIQWLFENDFHTIDLHKLYNYMRNSDTLPPKPIVLTFDDGYLDNWVNVYPILNKHNMKATIFVNPEYVNPTPFCRPNLEDVWKGKINKRELPTMGFLSWAEMQAMEESGLIDIQSHALTHTWYFKSDKIVDFYSPYVKADPDKNQHGYVWLYWNNYPHEKYNWMNDISQKIPYGTPIYDYGKALITKRYLPDERLGEYLIKYVNDNGAEHFFQQPTWKQHLLNVSEQYKREHQLADRYESDEEYRKRVKYELMESKGQIEKNLNKEVKFLCWPGGAYNDFTIELASECGYIATTIKGQPNALGSDASRIHRMGMLRNFFEPIDMPLLRNLSYAIHLGRARGKRWYSLPIKCCALYSIAYKKLSRIFKHP